MEPEQLADEALRFAYGAGYLPNFAIRVSRVSRVQQQLLGSRRGAPAPQCRSGYPGCGLEPEAEEELRVLDLGVR